MYRMLSITLIITLAAYVGTGCAAKNQKAAGTSSTQSSANSPCPHAAKAAGGYPAVEFKQFGEAMTLGDHETVGVSKVLTEPESFDGKWVRVAGKVDEVCAQRGCWLRLGDGKREDTLFVKFTCPVQGRLIPMNAVGRFAQVEGKFEMVEVSQDYARHLKEDAGASKEEIDKVVGPQKMLTLSSKSARISGI